MSARETKATLRNLHGADAEIIEMDSDDRPTGRRYTVVRRAPLEGWPLWLRVPIGILGIIVFGGGMIAGLVLCGWAAWFLWQIWH